MIKLTDLRIAGVSSLLRDLQLLADDVEALERGIAARDPDLSRLLRASLMVLPARGRIEVGDVVAFRPLAVGGYAKMETIWGEFTPLVVGQTYVGVVCNRCSTRLYAAELGPGSRHYEQTRLQLISGTGGIGYCTGFSPMLRGSGQLLAADVEVVGILSTADGAPMNTLRLAPASAHDLPRAPAPPTVLTLGTGTDVGKSTAMARLIRECSNSLRCGSIKGAGTGGYEDCGHHFEAGAFPSLDCTLAGLPTSYDVTPAVHLGALSHAYKCMLGEAALAPRFVEPAARGREVGPIDLLFVEMGGDLVWAGIDGFLASRYFTNNLQAIVLCAESVPALMGALAFLEEHSLVNTSRCPIWASLPLLNPQAFYRRIEGLIQRGKLKGVFDVNRPAELALSDARLQYAACIEDIMSAEAVAAQIVSGVTLSKYAVPERPRDPLVAAGSL